MDFGVQEAEIMWQECNPLRLSLRPTSAQIPIPLVQFFLLMYHSGMPSAPDIRMGGIHRGVADRSDLWGRSRFSPVTEESGICHAVVRVSLNVTVRYFSVFEFGRFRSGVRGSWRLPRCRRSVSLCVYCM